MSVLDAGSSPSRAPVIRRDECLNDLVLQEMELSAAVGRSQSWGRKLRLVPWARRVRSAVAGLPAEREGMMTLSMELHSIRSLNESSEASASDELYVLVTVASVRPPIVGLPIPAIPNFRVFSYGVFGDMDDDDPGPVIVRGPPFWGMDGPEDIADPDDVAIIVSVMEHDNGTPAQYVELLNAKTAISLGASAGAPSPAARGARLAADISNVLNAIDVPIPFAFDDDHIGTQQFVLDHSDLIPSGRKDRTMRFDGAGATVELGLAIHRIPQPAVPTPVDPSAPRVPGVVGSSIEDARQVLSDAGYGTQSRLAPHGTVEAGTVISQDPIANTPAFPPLTVHLIVAAEPIAPVDRGPEEPLTPLPI
jgi:PASTA domain